MTRRTWMGLGLIVLAAALVAGLDRVVEIEPDQPTIPAATTVPPVSGSWVCPVGDGREGTSLEVTVARPPAAGQQPAEVELEVLGDGEVERSTLAPLFPPSAATREVSLDQGAAVAATWRGGPATLQREWRFDGDDGDLPPGIAAGNCVQPYADRWIVPGMVTSGGSQALLRVANPFPTDATIGVSFVGTDGPVAPLALRNLSVGGRSTLEIDVNEFLPERDDLAAVVTVASGRVAAQGVQLVRSAIGGIDGVSTLEATAEPAEQWTVPWVVDRDDVASWLWIFNPSERLAAVELSYHTEDGGIVPDGLTEVLVEPGQLRRVDLRGTLPDGDQVVAVTTRSDGAPVVVSAAVRFGGDDVDRTAFGVQLGSPVTDSSWTVSGGPTEGRVEQLHLVNPGSEDVVASVSLFAGRTVDEPSELQDLEVPAGARRMVEIADGASDLPAWTAFVTASSGELVVGRVGANEAGPRRHVTVLGAASSGWMTETAGQLVSREEGLVQRLRTSLGIAAAERIGALTRDVITEPVEPGGLDAPPDDVPPGDAPPDDPLDEDAPLDGEVPPEDPADQPAEEPLGEPLPDDAPDADEAAGDDEEGDADTPVRALPGDGARAGEDEDDDADDDG